MPVTAAPSSGAYDNSGFWEECTCSEMGRPARKCAAEMPTGKERRRTRNDRFGIFQAHFEREPHMNWRQDYNQKCVDAREALETVHSGDRVWIQPSCGTPTVLVDALVARAPWLRDVEIVHMKTLGSADYTRPEYEGHFRHRGLFLGDNVREAVCNGRADYTPIFLSEIENLFE